MATHAQLVANRSNAARSTGPRSAAGKAKAAMNAVSHRLTAIKVVAGVEDRPLFEALRDQLVIEWRPGSVLEAMHVDRIAELVWQLRRVAGVEVQVIERMPVPRPPGLPPAIFPLADAMARDLARPNPTLLRVQVYQNRLERALHRTLAELRTLQIQRQMQDERDDLEDEVDSAPIPAPLPGERLGAGMPRQATTSEKADIDTSEHHNAPQSLGTSSPHLTSPQGEGPELATRVDSPASGFEKTNPISGLTDAATKASAAAGTSIGETTPPAPLPGERLGEGMERPYAISEKADANTSKRSNAPQPPGTSSPHLTSPRGEGQEAFCDS